MALIQVKGIVLLLVLCMCMPCLTAQKDFIEGKLLDAQTGEPVVFATIRVKGKSKGVISNMDGSFKVPQRFKALGDLLVISCLGYEKKEIPIDSLSLEYINSIRLEAGVMLLDEAVVFARKKRRLSARSIVRKAIKAIPQNFSMNPFSTVGYYRDYQRKDNNYVNLNEAILEVFDQGFGTFDQETTKTRIYEYLQNTNFERDARAHDKYDYKDWKKVINKAYLHNYGGNEFTILRIHDAIRNYNVNSYDYVNKLESDVLDNHQFRKEDPIFLEDESLYVIRFYNFLLDYKMYGKLYISANDFAIHKMEYTMYNNLRLNDSGKENKHGNDRQLIFEVTTEYKRQDGKMYLNYISFQNGFQLSRPPAFIVNEIVLNRPLKCFEVVFNKKVSTANALKKNNYDFRFKGRKIKFENIEVLEDLVRLYPIVREDQLKSMFAEMEVASRKRLDLKELLSAEVNGLVDLEGNRINERTYKDYLQFREFFVQQVKFGNKAPKDSLYMKKDKPIFVDQPITSPKNLDDYWMNTPLQEEN